MSEPTPPGRPSPLGAKVVDGGVNFSLFARTATGVELLFFDRDDDANPSRVVTIDPESRTYHYWHAFVPGVQAGQLYGYRVQGPAAPSWVPTVPICPSLWWRRESRPHSPRPASRKRC